MTSSPLPVTDVLSNYNDQLVNAARLLGRSKHRQAIFETVYRGKKQVKTIQEIMNSTELSQVHVLTEGAKMAGLLFDKVSEGYKKKIDISTRYKRILSLARNKKKLESLSTKTSPNFGRKVLSVNIAFPSQAQYAIFITIDEIDSFSNVKKYTGSRVSSLEENEIKEGFKKIIEEEGVFKDWGGEKSDLYSTNIIFKGRRIPTAIAFKGKGTSAKLVPAKMGKNGDQINRLFTEPAELFLVVYWGQIESSIISQMRAFAIGSAMSGCKVYYGVIDGNDLSRLIQAYPNAFRK